MLFYFLEIIVLPGHADINVPPARFLPVFSELLDDSIKYYHDKLFSLSS